MTFDRISVKVTCVTLPKDHCTQVPWKYVTLCGYNDLFFQKTWTKGHWPLDDLWPQVCWGHIVQVPWKYITDHFSKNLSQNVTNPKWPLDDFWPTYIDVTCVTLPKYHCVQVPWKYIKGCGYSDPFSETWTKGHWPLDDLWHHIC